MNLLIKSASIANVPLRIAIPVPAPRGTGRIEHLKTVISGQLLVASESQEPCHSDPLTKARGGGILVLPGTGYSQPGTYRLLNWNRLRAPFCPYFLRSFPRESRVTMPSDFNLPRSSALNCIRARAIPSFTASAWPRTPPPRTLATMLNAVAVSVAGSGAFAAERWAGVTKY